MNEEKILQAVCDYFHEDITKVRSKCQNANLVKMRHISIFFIDKYLDLPDRQVGKLFAGRSYKSAGLNHATVINARRVVLNSMVTDRFYASNIDALDKIISAL